MINREKEIPQGKGLIAQLEAYPVQSTPVTIEGLKEAFEKLALSVDFKSKKPIGAEMSGRALLSMNDDAFSIFYSMQNVTVYCSTDSFKEIEERAKKLGLKKK